MEDKKDYPFALEIQEPAKPKKKREPKPAKEPEPDFSNTWVTVRFRNGRSWAVRPIAICKGLAVTPLRSENFLFADDEKKENKSYTITHMATGAQICRVFSRKTKCIEALGEIADLVDWTLEPLQFMTPTLRQDVEAICVRLDAFTKRPVAPDGAASSEVEEEEKSPEEAEKEKEVQEVAEELDF